MSDRVNIEGLRGLATRGGLMRAIVIDQLELMALLDAVEATQGPEGCTFCGKPASAADTNHREDCPVARFDFGEKS